MEYTPFSRPFALSCKQISLKKNFFKCTQGPHSHPLALGAWGAALLPLALPSPPQCPPAVGSLTAAQGKSTPGSFRGRLKCTLFYHGVRRHGAPELPDEEGSAAGAGPPSSLGCCLALPLPRLLSLLTTRNYFAVVSHFLPTQFFPTMRNRGTGFLSLLPTPPLKLLGPQSSSLRLACEQVVNQQLLISGRDSFHLDSSTAQAPHMLPPGA